MASVCAKPDTARLSRIATRQHGVVHRRQLHTLGFVDSSINRLVAQGRLHRLYPAVYAVGHRDLSLAGRRMAAVMACRAAGGSSALSHRSAGRLHGLLRSAESGPADVTSTSRHRLNGIHAHHARKLDPADVTIVDEIPVTTVARTTLDLADVLAPQRLHDALEQALRSGKFDLREIQATIARNPGRHAIKPLLAQLQDLHAIAPIVDSGFEHDLRWRLRQAGAPEPLTQQIVAGEQVDLYWPDRRVIVEADGDNWHKLRSDRARDARRDRKLTLAGDRVLRVTDTEYAGDSNRVVADILTLLGVR